MSEKTTTEKILEDPDYFLRKEEKPKQESVQEAKKPRSATAFINELEKDK